MQKARHFNIVGPGLWRMEVRKGIPVQQVRTKADPAMARILQLLQHLQGAHRRVREKSSRRTPSKKSLRKRCEKQESGRQAASRVCHEQNLVSGRVTASALVAALLRTPLHDFWAWGVSKATPAGSRSLKIRDVFVAR